MIPTPTLPVQDSHAGGLLFSAQREASDEMDPYEELSYADEALRGRER
jgi:hypothetical protein